MERKTSSEVHYGHSWPAVGSQHVAPPTRKCQTISGIRGRTYCPGATFRANIWGIPNKAGGDERNASEQEVSSSSMRLAAVLENIIPDA